ncbi:protein kinase 2 [Cavenderia fasciculata]|uniref:non-specific serine/threonine protein kinase n=1 Tax=Cavenderia fasciculata TaxID=261658 RepID=F4PZJ6_CACFS|nr:protein kinase 2 [Cavenderia fasciculata]EGG18760.1 protein kinase 2 [Cavenderia fasciculata]|eukprot:XP_004357222.1 protein kinase 2 [Cavenderia fasciculata]
MTNSQQQQQQVMGKGHSKEKRSNSTSNGGGKSSSKKDKKRQSVNGVKQDSSVQPTVDNKTNTTNTTSTTTTQEPVTTTAASQQQNTDQQTNNNTNGSEKSTSVTSNPGSPTLSPSSASQKQSLSITAAEGINKENGATEASGHDSPSIGSSNSGGGLGNNDDGDEGPEETIFSKNKQTVTKDDFDLLSVIGKGSFGKVMQVKKKDDGKIYAMKVLRKDAIIARKQVNHTKSEKTILQGVSHPFIVNLHFAFQTRDKLYMILDFVNGGELFYHLKREGRFSEPRVKLYAAEIVSALAHLHQQDIVYRDLKPENILLDSDGHICITDFGLSKKIETTDGTFTFCGTPEYLAPEVLNGHGHGCAVDWWSLGTLLFEMLTGLPPFYSQNVSMMYQKILNGELKIPSYISPEAKSLLEGLLTRDVDRRLGSKGGPEVKNHPWFKNIDWDMLDRKEIEVHFKPKVKSGTDTSQIDPVFTQERPMDSVVEGTTLADAISKDNSFEGFTYVADSVLKI